MRRAIVAAVAMGLAAAVPVVHAYLKLGVEVGDNVIPLRWTNQPIRYFIRNRSIDGVSASELQNAVGLAFGAWSGVPDAIVDATFVGFTDAEPVSGDGMTVIGFRSRPDLDSTLGATTFVTDITTGALVEADIFLNSAFTWSASGAPGRYDVESIATHEIGHLLGLNHSAIGETEFVNGRRRVLGASTVMFPIAFPPGDMSDRVLQADDRAGISDLYGTDTFREQTGAISGRVTLDGAGVFGAHVLAFSPATGDEIGSFSLDSDGNFVVGGLRAGLWVVRAEPLDDVDASSFFDASAPVNTNFRPSYYRTLVAVPSGGTSSQITVMVTSK